MTGHGTTSHASAWRLSAAVITAIAALLTPATFSPPPPPAEIPEYKIDLNTATRAELQLLPRIGPALANAIVTDREANGPYRTLDELDRVPRIGPRTLITIAPDTTLVPTVP